MGTGAVAPSVRSERPTFGKPEGVAISHTGGGYIPRSQPCRAEGFAEADRTPVDAG
jgi:hypothetical protein